MRPEFESVVKGGKHLERRFHVCQLLEESANVSELRRGISVWFCLAVEDTYDTVLFRAGSEWWAYNTGAYNTVSYGIIPSGGHDPSYNWY